MYRITYRSKNHLLLAPSFGFIFALFVFIYPFNFNFAYDFLKKIFLHIFLFYLFSLFFFFSPKWHQLIFPPPHTGEICNFQFIQLWYYGRGKMYNFLNGQRGKVEYRLRPIYLFPSYFPLLSLLPFLSFFPKWHQLIFPPPHPPGVIISNSIHMYYGQGCGAGTGTGRNRIHLGTLEPEPEPYSEYGSGSGSEYKEMKPTTQKN